MRQFIGWSALVLGLMVGLVGCGTTISPPLVTTTSAAAAPAAVAELPLPADSDLVLVKMPAMVCDGCAKNVERDLAKVDGVKILALNPGQNMAKIAVLKNSNLDVQATLDKLAKTNDNIAGFEIVKTN